MYVFCISTNTMGISDVVNMLFFEDKKDRLLRPELLEDSLNTSVHSSFATGGYKSTMKLISMLLPSGEQNHWSGH